MASPPAPAVSELKRIGDYNNISHNTTQQTSGPLPGSNSRKTTSTASEIALIWSLLALGTEWAGRLHGGPRFCWVYGTASGNSLSRCASACPVCYCYCYCYWFRSPVSTHLTLAASLFSGFTDAFYKALNERYAVGSETCTTTSQWNVDTGGMACLHTFVEVAFPPLMTPPVW